MAMLRNVPVVVRPFAAAAAAALPLALALAAGQAYAQEQARTEVVAPASPLERARALLDAGKPIAARDVLVKAFEEDPTIRISELNRGEPSANREAAVELLTEANRKIRMLDPMEASLQRAEQALEAGDLRTAERHALAVQKNATSTSEQVERAAALARSVEQRRLELAPTIPDALAQAERDFLAGRYAQARAGFQYVERSGVRLTADQTAMLDRYQLKLVDLASEDPSIFGTPAVAGVMQPGTVRRRDEQPPAPAPAPAAQPEQPQQPSQPPAGGEDLVGQALRTEAINLLSQADQAFERREYPTAERTYIRVRSEFRDQLSPEQLRHVEDRIREAQVLMRRGAAPQPEELLRENVIRKQQTQATFDNDLEQASRALSTGNTTGARDLVAHARLILNSNRDVFAESEFEALAARADRMLDTIAAEEQQQLQRRLEEQERRVREEQQRAQELQRQERERKIVELIDRIRAYQSEQRYQEALQAVDQLLFLDQNNPTGLLLRDTLYDITVYRRSMDVYQRKQEGYAINSLDNQDASIPPPNIMNFPPDWPAISVRRGEPVQFAESPENRRILATLEEKRIPNVHFADNSLRDVLDFVQSITNLNMDVDWASLENANIQQDTTVSLNLTNVTAKTLLDRIVEKVSGQDRSSRADWAVTDGVITIASEDKIRRNTTLLIYDVRDLLHEIPDYREIPRIDLQQALQSSQGGGGGGGGQSPFREEGNDQQQLLRDREERLEDIVSIIQENVDFEGWVDNGGDTGKIMRLVNQGNLIITNTPKNHRQISGLLSKLREVRAMQINVETRFLLVNQDFFEQIGFDLDVYLNANNNQVRVARGVDPSVQPSDFFTGGTLNRTIVPAVQGPAISQRVVNPRGWSPIGFQQDSLGLSQTIAPRTDWSDTILNASPALGIAGQFLDDIQVDFLVQATQADRRSIQLTAPRLTFTNGQTANIYVATQTAFVSDLEPVVGDSAVGFDPTVSVVTEGVTLLVEGTVTSDRRYVTMNVDAGVARVDGFATQPVTAIAGGQLVSSQAVQSFIQLPQVTVTRVRTTVTVPDQGTILLGGQRLITEYEVETGVPVLSKLPVINRFFTNRIESREEQTLLILIKPTILIQNEEEERNYPGLLESIRSGGGFGG